MWVSFLSAFKATPPSLVLKERAGYDTSHLTFTPTPRGGGSLLCSGLIQGPIADRCCPLDFSQFPCFFVFVFLLHAELEFLSKRKQTDLKEIEKVNNLLELGI